MTDDIMTFEFLFPDRLSHRPRSGQSGVWLSVFRGSNEVWGGLHLVRTARRRGSVTASPLLQRRRLSRVSCVCVCVVLRGKGDYHRLGHGSDDHVRRPRQVQGLQGKKVIAIATGSLHCVCCTEDGRTDGCTQFGCSAQLSVPFCHLVTLTPNS